MKKLVHLSIKGKVQGVGYRAFVELQAELLGLEGWVRNRRDGSVEAIADGTGDAVEALIRECWKGPPAARVRHVDVSDGDPKLLGLRPAGEKFGTLPTA
jgi:acylphosphatase